MSSGDMAISTPPASDIADSSSDLSARRTMSARCRFEGLLRSFAISSGPIPEGSPSVTAMRARRGRVVWLVIAPTMIAIIVVFGEGYWIAGLRIDDLLTAVCM